MLEIPGREMLGGCEKHKLNGTVKLLKDKLIKMHTLLVQQVFFQMTVKMPESGRLCRRIYRCVPMMLVNSQTLGIVC